MKVLLLVRIISKDLVNDGRSLCGYTMGIDSDVIKEHVCE